MAIPGTDSRASPRSPTSGRSPSSADPGEPHWGFAGAGANLIGVAAMSVIYAPQPLLGAIAADFGRNAFEANLVVSATTLGIALGVFPLAWVSARLGRRRLIAGALAAGMLLTVLTATASIWWLLVLIRFLTGLVISAVLVSALVWAAEAVPRRYSRRVAALYVAGTTTGGMLGRLVAGLVTSVTDWRIGIIAVDAIVLLSALAGVWLITVYERSRSTRAGLTPRDAPLRGAGAPASALVSGQGGAQPGDRAVRIRLCVLGFLGTAVFVGIYNALVFRMLAPPFELGVGLTSLLFLTYGAGIYSSVRAGVIVDRLGLRSTLLIGLAMNLAGLILTIVDSVVAVVAGLLLLAAGFFIVHTAASSTMPSISQNPTRSSASYTLLYYAGSSAGALLLGYAWDQLAWTGVLLAGGALTLVAAVVVVTIPRRTPGSRNDTGSIVLPS